MRQHPIQAQYLTDPGLNVIVMMMVTVVTAMMGGLAGLFVRYLTSKLRRNRIDS
jgi:hypothetical protein